MNYRLLSKILGALLLLLAFAQGLCAAFSHLDNANLAGEALNALLVSAGITAFAGVMLLVSGLGKVTKFSRREGVAIVGLGWILSGIFGALPYILSPPHLTPAAAIFESVSGFTTTGSTAMSDIEAWPHGILMWRSLTQWLGGLGILVLFVVVLSYFGLGGKTLFRNESSFQTGEADTARIRDTAVLLWRIYLFFTIVCGLGLYAMGLKPEFAAMHAMTTMATGGFSPHNASVGHYSEWGNGWLIEGWIVVFMIIGSLNFLLWTVILKRRWGRLKVEEEGRWFLAICLIFALAISAQLVMTGQEESFVAAFRGAIFNVVSVISTTGFGTVDFELWPAFSIALLLLAMSFGGCAGSTSGGMKMRRLVLVYKAIRQDVIHTYRPQKVLRIEVNGTRVDDESRSQVLLFVVAIVLMTVIGTLVVASLESDVEVTLDTAFSSVFATLFNIGPGVGEVGPTHNFAWMKGSTQLFLSLMMIMGRLELFVIMALFVPTFWRRY